MSKPPPTGRRFLPQQWLPPHLRFRSEVQHAEHRKIERTKIRSCGLFPAAANSQVRIRRQNRVMWNGLNLWHIAQNLLIQLDYSMRWTLDTLATKIQNRLTNRISLNNILTNSAHNLQEMNWSQRFLPSHPLGTNLETSTSFEMSAVKLAVKMHWCIATLLTFSQGAFLCSEARKLLEHLCISLEALAINMETGVILRIYFNWIRLWKPPATIRKLQYLPYAIILKIISQKLLIRLIFFLISRSNDVYLCDNIIHIKK